MANDVVEWLRNWLQAHRGVGCDVLDRPFRPGPPCSPQALEDAERKLEFRLPGALRDVSMYVANASALPREGCVACTSQFGQR
jgi:hypothetical protein